MRDVTRTRPATSIGMVMSLVVLLIAIALPAAAADRSATRTHHLGQARFEGRTIDLRTGWGDARACVVWHAGGETDCFRSDAAADRAVARRGRVVALTAMHEAQGQPTSTCGSWLTLYEHVGHAGRSLRFRDQGTYQDLADWGFASQTSSYRIGSCATAMRDGGWTAYPGPTGPGDGAPAMVSDWNDRIRYLRIC